MGDKKFVIAVGPMWGDFEVKSDPLGAFGTKADALRRVIEGATVQREDAATALRRARRQLRSALRQAGAE